MAHDSEPVAVAAVESVGSVVVGKDDAAVEKSISGRSRAGREVSLVFQDLGATVATKVKGKKVKKPVLKGGVTGMLEPGKLTAIMGSSGAGKSTLLSILAGRAASLYELSGTLKMNGEDATQEMLKTLCAFVMQDDVMLPYLTVREQVEFYARFGLPRETAEIELQQRVDDLLEELELVKCQSTRVGKPGVIRGISGGERKRTAIAMELVGDPSVLFLDEPTSGLDSEISLQVMTTLKKLASRGRTIAFSIHQPSSEIFELFDNLILMCDGFMVYHGPASSAVEHFSRIGYEIPERSNPADYFLRVLHASSEFVQKKSGGSLASISIEDGRASAPLGSSGVKDASSTLTVEPATEELRKMISGLKVLRAEEEKALNAAAASSSFGAASAAAEGDGSSAPDAFAQASNLKKKRSNGKESGGKLAAMLQRIKGGKISWFWQLRWLILRSARQFFRNSETLVRFVQFVGVAVFASILFQGLEEDTSGVQGRVGFLFGFLLQFTFIVSQGVILVFPLERPVYLREQAKTMYHPFWYFVAKNITEAPVVILSVVVSVLITYFVTGLRNSAEAFFKVQLVYNLMALLGQSIGMIVGAAIADTGKGMEIGPSLIIPQMLVGGLLFNVSDIPVYLRWFEYISIFRYAFEAVLRAEFEDRALPASIFAPEGNGNQVLEYFNFEWSYGLCVGMLCVFLVIYRSIAFYFLWSTARKASPV